MCSAGDSSLLPHLSTRLPRAMRSGYVRVLCGRAYFQSGLLRDERVRSVRVWTSGTCVRVCVCARRGTAHCCRISQHVCRARCAAVMCVCCAAGRTSSRDFCVTSVCGRCVCGRAVRACACAYVLGGGQLTVAASLNTFAARDAQRLCACVVRQGVLPVGTFA